MADSAKVSTFDSVVLDLTTTISSVASGGGTVDFDLPISATGTLTSPAYKGGPQNGGRAPTSTNPTATADATGSAGASAQMPRHSSVWTQAKKGVGGSNTDSVTGSPGFSGLGVFNCNIVSVEVVSLEGQTSFELRIFRHPSRGDNSTALVLAKGAAQALGTLPFRLDYGPAQGNLPIPYADTVQPAKGQDGKLYCRLTNNGSAASRFSVRVRVEPR